MVLLTAIMQVVRTTERGIQYLWGLLKEKVETITRVGLFKVTHHSGAEDLSLKVGRYTKQGFSPETLECKNPKSELTLDKEEFAQLIEFLQENYDPFKEGAKKYIPLDEKFDGENIEHLRAIFGNPDKKEVVNFITKNAILPEDIVFGIEHQARLKAVKEFSQMLEQDLVEFRWQAWFKDNSWVLGSEYVQILDDRAVDVDHITDYLMQAYDGFLDLIEIKRPTNDLRFWADTQDHGNWIPSTDLTKAIAQATRYIYEVEREASTAKFFERVGIKAIKPRCVLIFGRSNNWNNEQREAYRLFNSSYHNLTILTYDHVLDRASRILAK